MRLMRLVHAGRRGRAPRDPRPARAAPRRTPRAAAAPETPTRAARRRRTPRPRSRGARDPRRARRSACARRRRQLDQHRLEQPLALEPAARQPLGDPLEQHPLVRDVLIDDRDALFVHGDDERVAELAERHHRPDRRARCELALAGRCDAGLAASARPPLVGATAAHPPVPARRRVRPVRPAARETSRRRRSAAAASIGCCALNGAAARACSSGAGPRPSASPSVAADHLVDVRLVAEPHLRLRRVHVDVDRVARHLDEQVHLRAALLDRRDAVGVDDGVRDRPVLDDAAVDEDVLRPARRPLLGQRRDVAEHLHVAAVAADLDQVAAARRRADTADRAATPPAGTGAPCARRWSA